MLPLADSLVAGLPLATQIDHSQFELSLFPYHQEICLGRLLFTQQHAIGGGNEVAQSTCLSEGQ